MWMMGLHAKRFRLAAVWLSGRGQQTGAEAGNLPPDDMPVEKTEADRGSRVVLPQNLARRITIFDLSVDSVSLSPSFGWGGSSKWMRPLTFSRFALRRRRSPRPVRGFSGRTALRLG